MAKRQIIDLYFDFSVWGINSAMEDYRFCWHLNELLHWKMKRIADIEFNNTKQKSFSFFHAYSYRNVIDFYTLEFIQNKNAGNYLIPELKNIDYLLLLNGEEDYFDESAFIQLISKVPAIQTIIPIDVQSLKSKQNLLIRHFNEHHKKKNENSSYYWPGF